jgi:hypothetical protein
VDFKFACRRVETEQAIRNQSVFSKMVFPTQGREAQGLKPGFVLARDGTAKAVPFPKPILETRSSYQQPFYEHNYRD